MDGTYERVKKVGLEQLLVDAESILTAQGAVDYIDSHAGRPGNGPGGPVAE